MTTFKICCFATLFLLGTPILCAEVDVSFPVVNQDPEKDRVIDSLSEMDWGKSVPVCIDGTLAYFSTVDGMGMGADFSMEIPKFDQIKEGMTFREIVSLLGPGRLRGAWSPHICWGCKDGRSLVVWPVRSMDERAVYTINLGGMDQRHKEVEELAKKLIAGIAVTNQEVKVTLTADTSQSKAQQAISYKVGGIFQRVNPLPRIDFEITRIEGGSVHCQYFYQPPPEGLLHYSERGSIILTQAGDGVDKRPAAEVESKAGDVGK